METRYYKTMKIRRMITVKPEELIFDCRDNKIYSELLVFLDSLDVKIAPLIFLSDVKYSPLIGFFDSRINWPGENSIFIKNNYEELFSIDTEKIENWFEMNKDRIRFRLALGFSSKLFTSSFEWKLSEYLQKIDFYVYVMTNFGLSGVNSGKFMSCRIEDVSLNGIDILYDDKISNEKIPEIIELLNRRSILKNKKISNYFFTKFKIEGFVIEILDVGDVEFSTEICSPLFDDSIESRFEIFLETKGMYSINFRIKNKFLSI